MAFSFNVIKISSSSQSIKIQIPKINTYLGKSAIQTKFSLTNINITKLKGMYNYNFTDAVINLTSLAA